MSTGNMAPEFKRRGSQADRILERLRSGPATNVELQVIAHRFGARLFDLTQRGGINYEVTKGDRPGVFVYTLTEDVQ